MRGACAILAAGTATRMDGAKLEREIDGVTLLEYAVRACAPWPFALIISPQLSSLSRTLSARLGFDAIAALRTNTQPQLGMTHSFSLALDALATDPFDHVAVVPADLPLLRSHHIASVFEAARRTNADVAFPAMPGGAPGHPVVFSRAACALVEHLPPGDTLRSLRDDERLRRTVVTTGDSAHFRDLDTPEAFAAFEAEQHDAVSGGPTA